VFGEGSENTVIPQSGGTKRKRRKRGTSTEKMYFTVDTENHIIQFNKEIDLKIRDHIYETYIKYPFEKLAENVLNTFKFSYFEVGPQDVQKEVVSFLVGNIHKYKEGKGKAFSYFSIIAKNFLILLNNTNYKNFKRQVDITEQPHDRKELIVLPSQSSRSLAMKEFMHLMVEYYDNNMGTIFKKKKDLDIANAVIELFRNCDRIENFNKKALYLYVRDMTECKTQHITKVINKMKSTQFLISKIYKNEGHLNVNEPISSVSS
jgi:hypothetical protein